MPSAQDCTSMWEGPHASLSFAISWAAIQLGCPETVYLRLLASWGRKARKGVITAQLVRSEL